MSNATTHSVCVYVHIRPIDIFSDLKNSLE